MEKLKLINSEGDICVDSRDIAEVLGRRHKDLCKNIRESGDALKARGIDPESYFISAEYEDKNTGKPRSCYLVTKEGCAVLCSKMSGDGATDFALACVEAFKHEDKYTDVTEDTLYPPAPVGIGDLISNVECVMHNQGSQPSKISEQTALILEHYGIPVVESFVEP